MASSAKRDYTGLLPIYFELPLSALKMKTRKRLAECLDKTGALLEVDLDNIPTEIMNDFAGVAKLSGHEGSVDTIEFENKVKSPTMTLLNRWIGQGVTIGKFWEYMYLLILQRHDVIHDCRQIIASECKKYIDQKMGWTRSADREPNIWDKMSDLYLPEGDDDYTVYFTHDAFVCYNQDDPEDKRFVQDLIVELEGRRGLRLYVPGRDDLLSASENTNTALDIERRGRRVIIVLSRSFLQSRFCVFLERFAQDFSTDERRARMISIHRESGNAVPDTLNDCNTLDYNDMNDINWALLTSTINERITGRTYSEFIRNRNSRRVSIPWPAGAHENTVPKVVTTSRNVQPLADPNVSPDHTAPKVVGSLLENVRPSGVSRSSEGGDINVPAPITRIDTSLTHDDETEPKHIYPDDQIDAMSTEHVEYQNQSITGMQRQQNTLETRPTQNPILTEPDEQTNSRTPQLLADQTASETLSEQLIYEHSLNDQQTEPSHSANVKPQEHKENNN